MLQFKSLETTHTVVVDGNAFSLTEADIDSAYCTTFDLVEDDHVGPAIITLGDYDAVLQQDDWEQLYTLTKNHIQDAMELYGVDEDLVIH